jgi:hypothetical protein
MMLWFDGAEISGNPLVLGEHRRECGVLVAFFLPW